MDKMTVEKIRDLKGRRKISCLTAYDYSFARILDQAGVDVLLVGDSLGMVILGQSSTRTVTMEDVVRTTEAVSRGTARALLVSDMPLGSFDTPDAAVKNARRLLSAGAQAVKIEGYGESLAVTEALVKEGIAVMGHLGLTPQVAEVFRFQGRTPQEAARIREQACAFEKKGVFSLVLECIPDSLAAGITRSIPVPTIGIGAGSETDGQILVTYDLLGLYPGKRPRFARVFADLEKVITEAVQAYQRAVQQGSFPNERESFHGKSV